MDTYKVHEKSLLPYTCPERVKLWVKHTQDLHQRNIEENAGKRKRIPSADDMTSSETDDGTERYSDLIVWEKPSTEPKKKYRWNQFPLQLKCEWLNCCFEDTSVQDFVKHVSYHIPDVEVRTDDEDNDTFACQWNSCDFETLSDKEFVRHVNFHSYHTKLKCIGKKMTELLNIPKCNLNSEGRNILPDFPVEFSCDWEDCSRVFNNSQMFFFHVASHLGHYNQQRSKEREKVRDISCGWLGCSSKFYSYCKLADHVKVHTQEKLTACPTCGGLFASITKLHDHCMSQVNSKSEFQCTSCYKYFATERLLRDHMRRHVNRFKCTFCDMTCPSPSSLSLHIRFRHLNSKPYKCSNCKFAAKTQRDLNTHSTIHVPELKFSCNICGFACRTKATLNRHKQDVHFKPKRIYCCHICSDNFYNGSQLTKHLFKYHNFQWTPGHPRFTYTKNEDGVYRLRPFRLETLEVTQEILQAEIDEHPASISEVCGSHYSVRQITQTETDDIRSGDLKRNRRKRKTVVISIDEIDKTGGVVRREVIETEEVPVQRKGGALVCNYSDGDGINNSNVECGEKEL